MKKINSQHYLDYSTQTVVIIDVTIIRVEVRLIIEIIQPRSPPNVIALDAMKSSPIQLTLESVLSWLFYQLQNLSGLNVL